MQKSILVNKNSQGVSILFSVLFLITIYLLYNTFSGDRGIIALGGLESQVASYRQTLENIQAERLNQEHRVMLLRPESLDLDLLGEQARRYLGYSQRDEVVISLK
jgi:cell division protein FtsB